MRRNALIIFCLNLGWVLFPVISPSRDPLGLDALFISEVTLFGRVLSSMLTPLLVAAALLSATIDKNNNAVSREVLSVAAIVSALMSISAAFGPGGKLETLVMALFFVLFTIYLSLLKSQLAGSSVTILRIFKGYFSIWLLAPLVAMAVDPLLFDMFFSLVDFSYHGLTNSRVGYGLWISVFILVLGRPRSMTDKFLMAVSVATLLLCQSRAAIVGLSIAFMYGAFRGTRGGVAAVRLVALAALALVPLFLWSVFGRDDALTIVSDERGFLYSRFLEFVERHWLLGHGSMYLIDIPEIDFYEVPAHNFLLQTVANYGVFALLAFLAYFFVTFRFLQSTPARMLLIMLFVYSMYQPVQGTGNFFNPITLLIFLITIAVEVQTTRTLITKSHPTRNPINTSRARHGDQLGPV